MLPIIRHVGFIDILVSLGHIIYNCIGFYKNPSSVQTDQGIVDQRRYVFYVLAHFLLVLRFISAVVLFGASFKEEFRKQFNACILWIFIALITIIILTIQLFISYLSVTEIVIVVLEVLFRIGGGFFVITYIRAEKDSLEQW